MNLRLYILLALFMGVFSCEKYIDIELRKSEPILVIDANIAAYDNTVRTFVNSIPTPILNYVSLTQSTTIGEEVNIDSSFYISTADVIIYTETDTASFEYFKDRGVYMDTNFIAQPGKTYYLTVNHNGKEYTSQTTIPINKPVIKDLFIKREEDNRGDDAGTVDYQVSSEVEDNGSTKDYYFYQSFHDAAKTITTLNLDRKTRSDRFFNGNVYRQLSLVIPESFIEPGTSVNAFVTISSISREVYDYYYVLLKITGEDFFGGPIIANGNPETNIVGDKVTGVFAGFNTAFRTKPVFRQ